MASSGESLACRLVLCHTPSTPIGPLARNRLAFVRAKVKDVPAYHSIAPGQNADMSRPATVGKTTNPSERAWENAEFEQNGR